MKHFYTSCKLDFNTAKGAFEFVFSTGEGHTYCVPREEIGSSQYRHDDGRLTINYLNWGRTRITIRCSNEAARMFDRNLLR